MTQMQTQAQINEIQFTDNNPQFSSFAEEVINGLNKTPRCIPPKFFYDKRGSHIFETICETDEYYVTRTEIELLKKHNTEIAELIGSDCLLVEPGSGSSQKVRILLDELKPQTYLPMDISRDYLASVAQELADEFKWLDVHAACIDYTVPIDLSFVENDSDIFAEQKLKKIAFFPGSSIGNFEKSQASNFLKNMVKMLGHNGGLLIGVDLKKDPSTLHAAYNDTDGATAEFNLNLLTRINRELGANFNKDDFSHHAFYNEQKGRIEMHLVSNRPQSVLIDSEYFHFEEGETIHTENSYKYHIDEFQELASKAGFKARRVWTDEQNLFSLHYFEVAGKINL
jgi:dimethylhistidine N-methyltransferase